MKSRLPAGYGGGAGNMNSMIKQAQKMQEEMQKRQEELDVKEFTSTSGGGAVKVLVTGKREVKEIAIQPDVVDPEDIEMLQDLLIAAVNEAMRQVDAEIEENMQEASGGISFPGLF